MFIVFRSFGESLVTKCMSLNNEPRIARPFPMYLNPVELKYYPCVISLDKRSGDSNSVDDLSLK